MKSFLVLQLLIISNLALAEACTYREAMMALEEGNAVRGMALMRMASRDGDKRAVYFLARKDNQSEKAALMVTQLQKTVASQVKR